ncbi:hypothetical protein, partial [Shewanella sp.]|uniref:hypothetical protein n=1 Tax=Shewanella sp. TaxID=50422 RepID=UPI003F36BDCE
MAIINHYTRDSGGDYKITQSRYDSAAAFCVDKIPDGVPFRVYRDGVDVTKDIDAMLDDGSFTIIESAGELMTVLTVVSLVLGVATAFMMPKPGATANQQAESPNNSLTARSNKPRPYERVYDICGTVQTITSDLMQTYRIFDEQSREFEYGYYYAARGYIDTPASVITDGDTLLSEITGSSVNIYDPFTSPNNSEPRQIVGEKITEPLFISVRSNEVDGIELKAPNEAGVDLDGGCRLTYYDAPVKSAKVEYISEDVDFTESFTVGSTLVIRDCAWVKIVGNGATENVIIDGEYECLESANDYVIIKVIDSSKWINLDGSPIVNERT